MAFRLCVGLRLRKEKRSKLVIKQWTRKIYERLEKVISYIFLCSSRSFGGVCPFDWVHLSLLGRCFYCFLIANLFFVEFFLISFQLKFFFDVDKWMGCRFFEVIMNWREGWQFDDVIKDKNIAKSRKIWDKIERKCCWERIERNSHSSYGFGSSEND